MKKVHVRMIYDVEALLEFKQVFFLRGSSLVSSDFETAKTVSFAITFRCVLQILYHSYLVHHSSVKYALRLHPHEI